MKIVDVRENNINVGIRGMGYYVPDNIITNKDLEKTLDTTDEWIQEKIGIKERRIVSKEQAASDLAIEAGKRALNNANIDPKDIDLVITTSLQPDHRDPMPCCLIAYKLGCNNAAAFHMAIGGCPDSVYSLITASQYIFTGSCKNILLINTEVNSKSIDWNDRTTCVFFGDGAGAWVLSPVKKGKGILGYVLGTDGSGYDLIQADSGGSRQPITKDELAMKSNYIHMNGKKVFESAIRVFPESVNELLKLLNISKDDVALYLAHQANINIINKSLEIIGVGKDKTYTNIHKYGNMASASLPVVLADAIDEGLIKEDKTISLTAFGAGFAWGSVMIKWPFKEDYL